MKIVNIFLASSINDLDLDRLAIGDFVNQLNNIYFSHDIRINLYKCEDESIDHTVAIGGTQKSLNELIVDSDFCLVLFWHKAGNVTEDELKIALDSFKKQNSPKVVVYFKVLKDGKPLTDDLQRVMNLIDKELQYYHREYEHIDSLKLGILMQLQSLGFIRVDMSVVDEHLTIGGEKIASTDNIPVYSKNEEYHNLLNKMHEIESKCEDTYKRYNADKNNARLYREYLQLIKEKTRLSDDLSSIGKEILNVGKGIVETVSNNFVTNRIREAIHFFDIGDYDGVLSVLNPEELDNCFEQANLLEEQANIYRMKGIEEYRLRIIALQAQGKWNEVEATYKRIISFIIDTPNIPKTIVLEFSQYLFKQKKYKEALENLERLKSLNIKPDILTKDEEATIYDLFGELYNIFGRYEEAITSLKNAIEIRKNISNIDSSLDYLVANSMVKLAKVYFALNQHWDAEKMYMSALERYKNNDTVVVDSIDVHIANASLELGDLYYMINRHENAARLFLDAYNKFKELVNQGEKKFLPNLAESASRFVRLSVAVYSHAKREPFYIESFKVKYGLSKYKEQGASFLLHKVLKALHEAWEQCGNIEYANKINEQLENTSCLISDTIGDVFDERENIELNYDYYKSPLNKALIEKIAQEALYSYRILADENPEAYELNLAKAYDFYGMFCSNIFEKDKAEELYTQAVEIKERISKREESLCIQNSYTYENIGRHFFYFDEYEESISYFKMAIDVLEKASSNKKAFQSDKARNYNYLAETYAKYRRKKDAEDCYFKSITIYIELYKRSPRAFVDRLINTTNNILSLFSPLKARITMKTIVDINDFGEI